MYPQKNRFSFSRDLILFFSAEDNYLALTSGLCAKPTVPAPRVPGTPHTAPRVGSSRIGRGCTEVPQLPPSYPLPLVLCFHLLKHLFLGAYGFTKQS